MTSSDFIGLTTSYAYAIGLLVVGEVLRRLLGQKPELTRKFIHIGAPDVGFRRTGPVPVRRKAEFYPTRAFIGLNYLFYRYRLLGAMDTEDSSPGTVYFAVSVTLPFGLLWRPDGPVERAPIATVGVMAMTWGPRTPHSPYFFPKPARYWQQLRS